MRPFVEFCSDLYTPRDRKNLRRVNYVLLGWAVAFLGATYLIREGLAPRFSLALTVATVILGVGAVVLYSRFLRDADELLRKVQMEGLAVGFGGGAVFMMSWRLFERLGAPKLDMNDPLLVMIALWVIGQFVAMRRYS